ncbi:hypothetical protein F2Q65_07550 [Thiohalocapsa marina]|uniref:Uncharacterized protein n=1 Tax=Thiohalocapsa marina TaxID=424902 RepID=A0A5M8FM10_9GAMM|nr:hypothetical protein F2Q65_07550 [Thiohalocapsa marina]
MGALGAGALLSGALLSGCGGGLVAPEGPASNAFLDQVQARCGNHSIGSQTIGFLLGTASDDTYFVDVTSKLGAGRIDATTFSSDIDSFYPAGNNQAAIDCIVGLL